MPQLEQIHTYLSQVFWLVITFGFLCEGNCSGCDTDGQLPHARRVNILEHEPDTVERPGEKLVHSGPTWTACSIETKVFRLLHWHRECTAASIKQDTLEPRSFNKTSRDDLILY